MQATAVSSAPSKPPLIHYENLPTLERCSRGDIELNGDGKAGTKITVSAKTPLLIDFLVTQAELPSDARKYGPDAYLSEEHRFYGLQITTLHYIALAVMDYQNNRGYESTVHPDDQPEPPSSADMASESIYHRTMRSLDLRDRRIIERICFAQIPSKGDLSRSFTALGDKLAAAREHQENTRDEINYVAFENWKEGRNPRR